MRRADVVHENGKVVMLKVTSTHKLATASLESLAHKSAELARNISRLVGYNVPYIVLDNLTETELVG